jgi:hypothetical protein
MNRDTIFMSIPYEPMKIKFHTIIIAKLWPHEVCEVKSNFYQIIILFVSLVWMMGLYIYI